MTQSVKMELKTMCIISLFVFFFAKISASRFEDADIITISSELKDGGISFTDIHDRVRRETDSESREDEQIIQDNHTYYMSEVFYTDKIEQYWTELQNDSKHHVLSNRYNWGSWANLTFEFPFYGHKLHRVAITTAGFISTSPYFHNKMYHTQYIAPFMANYNPSLFENSTVFFEIIGEKFVVEWRDLYVHYKDIVIGPFHFQTIVHKDGRIMFLYKTLPGPFSGVTVGLSEASFFDTHHPRLKKYFTFNRVDINSTLIRNGTVVSLTPLPTCNLAEDCQTCVSRNISFACEWCDVIKRCSDGMDRLTQDWYKAGCFNSANKQCNSGSTDDPHSSGIPGSTVKTVGNSQITEEPHNTVPANGSSQTRASLTGMPLTNAPTTERSQTTVPTTERSHTTVPTTDSLQTTVPSTKIPYTSSSTTERSQTSIPTTDSPQTSASTTESPLISAPTTYKPQTSYPTTSLNHTSPAGNLSSSGNIWNTESRDDKSSSPDTGLIVLLVIIAVSVLVSVCGVFFYAYKHPSSSLAIWLLEHRPSNLVVRFRRRGTEVTETTPVTQAQPFHP